MVGGRTIEHLRSLDDAERIDALVEIQRRRAALDAEEQRLLAVIDTHPARDPAVRAVVLAKGSCGRRWRVRCASGSAPRSCGCMSLAPSWIDSPTRYCDRDTGAMNIDTAARLSACPSASTRIRLARRSTSAARCGRADGRRVPPRHHPRRACAGSRLIRLSSHLCRRRAAWCSATLARTGWPPSGRCCLRQTRRR